MFLIIERFFFFFFSLLKKSERTYEAAPCNHFPWRRFAPAAIVPFRRTE